MGLLSDSVHSSANLVRADPLRGARSRMAPNGVEDWVVVDGPETSSTPSAPISASAMKRRRQKINRKKNLHDGQAAAASPRAPEVSLEKKFQLASTSPSSRTPGTAVFLDTQSDIMDQTLQARPGDDVDVLNTSLEEDVRALQRLLACELAVASSDAAGSTRHQPSTPSASSRAISPAGILSPEIAASLQGPDLVLSNPENVLSDPRIEEDAPFSPHASPGRQPSLPPRSPVPPSMLQLEQDAPSLPPLLILPAQPEAPPRLHARAAEVFQDVQNGCLVQGVASHARGALSAKPANETELGWATAGGGAREEGGGTESSGAPSNPGVEDGSISVSGGRGGGGVGLGEGAGKVAAHLAAVRSEWGPESLARGVGQVKPEPEFGILELRPLRVAHTIQIFLASSQIRM